MVQTRSQTSKQKKKKRTTSQRQLGLPIRKNEMVEERTNQKRNRRKEDDEEEDDDEQHGDRNDHHDDHNNNNTKKKKTNTNKKRKTTYNHKNVINRRKNQAGDDDDETKKTRTTKNDTKKQNDDDDDDDDDDQKTVDDDSGPQQPQQQQRQPYTVVMNVIISQLKLKLLELHRHCEIWDTIANRLTESCGQFQDENEYISTFVFALMHPETLQEQQQRRDWQRLVLLHQLLQYQPEQLQEALPTTTPLPFLTMNLSLVVDNPPNRNEDNDSRTDDSRTTTNTNNNVFNTNEPRRGFEVMMMIEFANRGLTMIRDPCIVIQFLLQQQSFAMHYMLKEQKKLCHKLIRYYFNAVEMTLEPLELDIREEEQQEEEGNTNSSSSLLNNNYDIDDEQVERVSILPILLELKRHLKQRKKELDKFLVQLLKMGMGRNVD